MNLIADTCFWISLCDPSQGNHVEIKEMADIIFENSNHQILVPHPVLYETLCTKMVKSPNNVMLLSIYLNKVKKVSDKEYINEAYQRIELQASMKKGTASMVDIAIMLMAEDPRNNIKGILTINGRDFSVVCQRHRILMLDSLETLSSF